MARSPSKVFGKGEVTPTAEEDKLDDDTLGGKENNSGYDYDFKACCKCSNRFNPVSRSL